MTEFFSDTRYSAATKKKHFSTIFFQANPLRFFHICDILIYIVLTGRYPFFRVPDKTRVTPLKREFAPGIRELRMNKEVHHGIIYRSLGACLQFLQIADY